MKRAGNSGRHRPERIDKQGTWFTPRDAGATGSFPIFDKPGTSDDEPLLVRLPKAGEPLLVQLPFDYQRPVDGRQPAESERRDDRGAPPVLTTTQRRVLAAGVGAVAVGLCALVVWIIIPGSSTTPPSFAATPDRVSASLPPVGNAPGTWTLTSSAPQTSSAIEANQTTAAPTTSASARKTTATTAARTTAPAAPTTTAAATATSPSPATDSATSTSPSGDGSSSDTGSPSNTVTSASSASTSPSDTTSASNGP